LPDTDLEEVAGCLQSKRKSINVAQHAYCDRWPGEEAS
jgi:hypothetical protein